MFTWLLRSLGNLFNIFWVLFCSLAYLGIISTFFNINFRYFLVFHFKYFGYNLWIYSLGILASLYLLQFGYLACRIYVVFGYIHLGIRAFINILTLSILGIYLHVLFGYNHKLLHIIWVFIFIKHSFYLGITSLLDLFI